MSPLSYLPLLIVLAPTGETRDGLPVFHRHPDAARYEAVLTHGFSGRLLRLFRWEQQYLAHLRGAPVEPAYLLLSDTQGGFPRFGFWLDGERKADAGYVDLHRRQPLSGKFGAIDQIFPHELIHVIVRQLAGTPPPEEAGANQVHAIGVRTDRLTAFDEGLAEHVQLLAVDDPDAMPETRALTSDRLQASFAADRLARYQRSLEARMSLAPPARLAFVLWFSQTEQVLRYHAVKANAFARDPIIPPRLLNHGDPYPAYLIENLLPGSPETNPKSTPRLLATEGVVAALFSRWVVDPILQQPADPTLYDRFDVRPADVAPLEHAYLKMFVVLASHHPHDAAAFVRAYVDDFPRDAAAVASLLQRTGVAWPLADVPQIWLANDRFATGTTVFDQYRAVPRVHTFDLNAASLVDLVTIDGITPTLAVAIQRASPYWSIDDVSHVAGATAALVSRLHTMATAMAAVRDANAREDAESIDLMRIFAPVIRRAVLYLLCAAAVAAWLHGRVRHLRPVRLIVNGLAASFVGLLSAWALGASLQVRGHGVEPALLSLMPLVTFGMPGALWQVARRSWSEAGRVAAAWAVACAPGLVIVTPLF